MSSATDLARYEGIVEGASRRRRRQRWLLIGLFILALALAASGLVVGAVELSMAQVVQALMAAIGLGEAEPLAISVITSIRLPRVIFAMIVGATLAVAGASLQGIFRNPLADPGLIGVSSGAALAVAVVIVAGLTQALPFSLAMPTAGFVGGMAVTAVVYRLATRGGRTDVATMLLAGIAINAFAGAGLGIMIYLSDDAQLRDLTMWTLGGLGGASWRVVAVTAPLGLLAVVGLLGQQRALNAMLLGEAEAFHLGEDTEAIKRRVVALAALCVGATVGFAGMIGFVGLVVPHLLRLMGGTNHRFVLPGSAILGAGLLVGADNIARSIAAPAEVPIGVITALVGAPFFLFLLMRRRRGQGSW